MRGSRIVALLVFSVTAASCSASSKIGANAPTPAGSSATGSNAATTLPASTPSTTHPVATPPDDNTGLGSYLPLYPFASASAAAGWQDQSGDEQWHLDPGQTALEFASWLGYANVNAVIAVKSTGPDAFVTVGFHPSGTPGPPVISAVVHAVRWGGAAGSPWEVVGTQDTTFGIENPRYGSTVTSPVKLAGEITGLDQSIKVTAQQLSTPGAVGVFCCVSVSGEAARWSASIPLSAPSPGVMTIGAEAGDHPSVAERFTVTGVRIAG